MTRFSLSGYLTWTSPYLVISEASGLRLLRMDRADRSERQVLPRRFLKVEVAPPKSGCGVQSTCSICTRALTCFVLRCFFALTMVFMILYIAGRADAMTSCGEDRFEKGAQGEEETSRPIAKATDNDSSLVLTITIIQPPRENLLLPCRARGACTV